MHHWTRSAPLRYRISDFFSSLLGSNGGTLIAVRPAYRSSMLNVRSSFLQLLACPQDHSRLRADDDNLVCEHRHRFNVEEGIPILIDNPRREATPRNMEPCHFI